MQVAGGQTMKKKNENIMETSLHLLFRGEGGRESSLVKCDVKFRIYVIESLD